MAKLDKIKFAQLISYISHITGSTLATEEVAAIDATIDVEAPEKVLKLDELHELMRCMMTAKDEGFIPAIKAYRTLTGVGLKEAKDAVEKYR